MISSPETNNASVESVLEAGAPVLRRLQQHIKARRAYHEERMKVIQATAEVQLKKKVVDQHQGVLSLMERERMKSRSALSELQGISEILGLVE